MTFLDDNYNNNYNNNNKTIYLKENYRINTYIKKAIKVMIRPPIPIINKTSWLKVLYYIYSIFVGPEVNLLKVRNFKEIYIFININIKKWYIYLKIWAKI